MKIALVYFEQKLENKRKHHEVNNFMLKGWQHFYEKSKTTTKPCLLLDSETKCPNFWKYESIVIKDANPPSQLDVLNKVGWIKSQAFKYVGKCIVMDIDAIILKPIDDLQNITECLAMSPDSGTEKNDWIWYSDWKIKKYNAGVLYINCEHVLNDFRKLWTEKEEYLKITYFDEIIFSSLLNKYGKILDKSYNTEWSGFGTNYSNAKVIHFSGNKKDELKMFLKTII